MMSQFLVETSLKNFPNQVLVRAEKNILSTAMVQAKPFFYCQPSGWTEDHNICCPCLKNKKKDGTTCGLAYVSAAVYRRVMANITSSLLKTLSLYIRDWIYDRWYLAITSLISTDDLCHGESNLLECHSQKKCFLSIIHAQTKYIILKKTQQKLKRTYEISHDLIWSQFRNNFVLFKVHVEDIFPISKPSANIQELPHLTLKVVWVTVLPWLITLGSHLEQKL